MKDALYFPRRKLAGMLTQSLYDGITHAFTLFAPRRMGKTQFLLKDVLPLAEQHGFNVFYFSFMDNADADFQTALYRFAGEIQNGGRAKTFLSGISKVEVLGVGIERETAPAEMPRLSDLISLIAQDDKPSLLLLDEIQELARGKDNAHLVRSLRTGLDINQDKVKTIFTGSSTNGLRAMFNDHKAPFFHFSHALDFPKLGREFTDFLAAIYQARTGNEADGEAFYRAFEAFHFTPLYMRAMTQDLIVTPELSIEAAVQNRLAEMHASSDTARIWTELSAIERIILRRIAHGQTALYTAQSRREMAAEIGIEELSTSTVQGNIRKLERKELITRNSGNNTAINSPLLQTWIVENTD